MVQQTVIVPALLALADDHAAAAQWTAKRGVVVEPPPQHGPESCGLAGREHQIDVAVAANHGEARNGGLLGSGANPIEIEIACPLRLKLDAELGHSALART